jgi:DNA polymerase-3 subunit delta'
VRFSEVIGQQELKKKLIEEVKNDKLSHAQLFLGKSGYGGLQLINAFVQFLFGENKQSEDSCGECANCRKINSQQHPDVHYSFPVVQTINKTSNPHLQDWRGLNEELYCFSLNDWIRKIDPRERKPIISVAESEEIIRKLSLSSYEGGLKVMIIWMADHMNTQCANKLLKILEEPPANTLFLLTAESKELMLTTILSRTQVIRVPRVEHDQIARFIKERYSENNSVASSIASRAEGDLVAAQDLVSQETNGEENHAHFVQLMRVCYKKNVLEMMAWAEELGGNSRAYQKSFLAYALHMCRQSILKNYTDDVLTKLSEEEETFLNNFSKFITGNNIIEFSELFSNSHYQVDRNANGKILFTNLCFQVMRFIHKV